MFDEEPAMPVVGRKVLRMWTIPKDGDDRYYLELDRGYLDVWCKGWIEMRQLPLGAKPLEISTGRILSISSASRQTCLV